MGKKFMSPTGEDIRIALLDGHVAVVSGEWRDLPEYFHKEAYAAGCISDDMAKLAEIKLSEHTVNAIEKVALKKEEIKAAIRELLENYDKANFTAQNLPKSTVLKSMIGKSVSNSERDEVWYALQQEQNFLEDNDDS